jgi:hypothetical protein
MPIIKVDGHSVAPERLSSKDKKPSAELRELVARLPGEAKEKTPHFIAQIEKVEHTEKFAEGNQATIERLKSRIADLESGDANLIQGLQSRLDAQAGERRVVIRTALLMFAAQHSIEVDADKVENLVRLL